MYKSVGGPEGSWRVVKKVVINYNKNRFYRKQTVSLVPTRL